MKIFVANQGSDGEESNGNLVNGSTSIIKQLVVFTLMAGNCVWNQFCVWYVYVCSDEMQNTVFSLFILG